MSSQSSNFETAINTRPNPIVELKSQLKDLNDFIRSDGTGKVWLDESYGPTLSVSQTLDLLEKNDHSWQAKIQKPISDYIPLQKFASHPRSFDHWKAMIPLDHLTRLNLIPLCSEYSVAARFCRGGRWYIGSIDILCYDINKNSLVIADVKTTDWNNADIGACVLKLRYYKQLHLYGALLSRMGAPLPITGVVIIAINSATRQAKSYLYNFDESALQGCASYIGVSHRLLL